MNIFDFFDEFTPYNSLFLLKLNDKINEKNNLFLFFSNFKSKFFYSYIGQYTIFTFGLFIINNNEREECNNVPQYFLIIKMFRKNKLDKFNEFLSLIFTKNTLLILIKMNIDIEEFENSLIKKINKIQNLYFKFEKNKEKKFILYSFCEIIFVNIPLFIIFKNTNVIKNKEIFERRENIIFYTGKRGDKARNYSPKHENGLFDRNNININTCKKLTDNKKNKNNDIITVIKQRKEGNKILIKNKNHLINFIEITKLIILLNLFNNIIVNNKISFIEYNSYNITLKIKGIGTKNIFSSDSNYCSKYHPDEVYINGYKKNDVTHSYNLNQTDNFIGLIWYNLISSCDHMFYGCSDITDINLTNFNTSIVENMRDMFNGCSSLTSLNLSNFDTSKVKKMNRMFSNCSSLTSLNLSNFDTSNVEKMNRMFNNCSSLTSLNLSNFETSKVKEIDNMFDGCKNLEYINMLNFKEKSLGEEYSNMFDNVPKNIVVCINKNNIQTKIYNQISNITCSMEDCSDDWKLKQNKIIEGSDECFNNCPNTNRYEYNGQCISQCTNGYFIDDNNITKCKCKLEKCFTCPTVALIKNLCTKCNVNYYQMENDPSNLGEYFNCYNETPTGYYLDRNDSLYKKCYNSCKICKIKGDNEFHNCLKCNDEFNFEINTSSYLNCYKNCNYYYFDNKNYFCIKNKSCPQEYPTLIKYKNECVKNTFNKIDDLIFHVSAKYKNNETIEDNNKAEEIETNYYNEIITNIESIITDNNFDTSNLDEGEEKIIIKEKMTITLTTTNTEKNNLINTNYNMTMLDLGQCENDLRYHYNLSDDKILYMEKFDVSQSGLKISKIEYRIYCKLHGTNLVRLNISICKNSKIFLSRPMELNGDINKLNTSSGYFNDLCYTSTSNSGTDISLRDRQKEYVEGEQIVCQEDCSFAHYNSTTLHANCSCNAKESSDNFENMKINKERLYENFGYSNNKKSTNFAVASCNVFDSTENIISNIGFFLLLLIFAIFIIVIIFFCSKGYNLLRNKIDEIIYKKFKNKSNSKSNKIIKNYSKKKKLKKSTKTKVVVDDKMFINKRENNNKLRKKSKARNSSGINKQDLHILKNSKSKRKSVFSSNDIFFNSYKKTKTTSKKKKNQIKVKFKPDTNYELNWLSYEAALIFDKRTNCDYYGGLIKSKQIFIFTFCTFNDYNSGIIKKFILFLSFALHYTSNAFFLLKIIFIKSMKIKVNLTLNIKFPIFFIQRLFLILF